MNVGAPDANAIFERAKDWMNARDDAEVTGFRKPVMIRRLRLMNCSCGAARGAVPSLSLLRLS